jgi:F-type H+-transporting ATPase subunit epsilon
VADGGADKVAFQLVAPERLLVAAEVDMVVVPGAEGDFGVLPLHSPFMSVLRPGVIETYEGNQVSGRIFVGGGFAEVNERGCTVLAEEAMPVEEIDVEQARTRLSEAQEDLRELADEPARARLERAIRVAEAQIQAAAGG